MEGSGKKSKSRSRMGNETKMNGGASMAGGGGFRAKMEHYVYSGEKKHVMVGIGIITLIFGVPWYLMTQGSISHRLVTVISSHRFLFFFLPMRNMNQILFGFWVRK